MLILDGQPLTLEQIARVAYQGEAAALSERACHRISIAREVVGRIIEESRVVYGVNTGFGKLSEYSIAQEKLAELQLNLVRSHACGIGSPLSIAETRAMMLLRAAVLAQGYSGARLPLVQTLLTMLERGVLPIIPEKGSVGASGDLAPLAHLALAVIGEGESLFEGERLASANAMQLAGIRPIRLEAKEGLALLNGTQAMTAVGALALLRAERATTIADVAGAMTLEALRGTPVPFDKRIHDVRPHRGQSAVASHMRHLLRDSEIRQSHLTNDPRVQDAYSLRCIPQVHGATRDALVNARLTVEIETGSATDNPLIFSDSGDILSGGNFHGAPLGLGFDFAAIALVHLASICERRIDRLINPDSNEGLPPFLTEQPGTSSGYMVAHVSAVALLNEMKVLAHPATTDNLPTSGGKEDHVSMGMSSALKLRNIVGNLEYIIAIELLTAAEGLEYRAPLQPGRGVAQAYAILRRRIPRLTRDRSLAPDIEAIAQAIRDEEFDL